MDVLGDLGLDANHPDLSGGVLALRRDDDAALLQVLDRQTEVLDAPVDLTRT
jgi:hypothetical protein